MKIKEPIVIAEIGCNHKGDMEIAKEMIMEAKKFCNADIVKFQKRDNKKLLSEEEYNTPHPVPYNSYGDTYGEHREFLEFNSDQHKELMDYCNELGIEYSTSVWDKNAAAEMIVLKPKRLKIPSACNTDFELLEHLVDNFDGELHISLGMTTRKEEEALIGFLEEEGVLDRTVLYACTSGYPVPFEEIFLFEITRLKEAYGNKVKGIGFSGHHLGIAADIAALAMGAEYIERHFTLDRTWKGTDHAASLEPGGLRKLVRDLKNVSKSLNARDVEISESEKANRDKLKRVRERLSKELRSKK